MPGAQKKQIMDSKETALAGRPIDLCKCFDLSVSTYASALICLSMGTFLLDFDIEYMCAIDLSA